METSPNLRPVSFVIPCYNAQETLSSVVAEIETVSQSNHYQPQLILVNDGSSDGTWPLIQELTRQKPWIRGLDLARNFGQAKARLAAIPYLTGEVTVYLDDDGQHPLDQVQQLIARVDAGDDLVFARFAQKAHNPLRKLASTLNGRILELTGAKPKGVRLSSFFALSPLAVRELQAYRSPFPSFTSYIMQCTDRVSDVPLPHRPRLAGHSGYTLGKLFSQWLTGLTNFSIVPLRVSSALGAVIAGAGFIYGLVLTIRKLLNPQIVAGYTSLMAVILLVGGLLMLMLGLLGEYVGRIYMTISQQPVCVVRRQTPPQEEQA